MTSPKTSPSRRKPTRPAVVAKARPAAAVKAAATDHTEITAANLRLDLPGLLEKLQLPGLDIAALVDSRRKDVQALLAANEQVYRGVEAVLRRQGEMLGDAMKHLGDAARDALAAKAGTSRLSGIGTQAKQAFGQALADMKEIAELSARSQQQVVDTLNKRLRDGIGEAGGHIRRVR